MASVNTKWLCCVLLVAIDTNLLLPTLARAWWASALQSNLDACQLFAFAASLRGDPKGFALYQVHAIDFLCCWCPIFNHSGSVFFCSVSLGYLRLDAKCSLIWHWGSAQLRDSRWQLGASREHERAGNRLLSWWLWYWQWLPSTTRGRIFKPGPVTASPPRGLPRPIWSPSSITTCLYGQHT